MRSQSRNNKSTHNCLNNYIVCKAVHTYSTNYNTTNKGLHGCCLLCGMDAIRMHHGITLILHACNRTNSVPNHCTMTTTTVVEIPCALLRSLTCGLGKLLGPGTSAPRAATEDGGEVTHALVGADVQAAAQGGCAHAGEQVVGSECLGFVQVAT